MRRTDTYRRRARYRGFVYFILFGEQQGTSNFRRANIIVNIDPRRAARVE